MLRPLRMLLYAFCAPGVIAGAYLFYLHGTYAETMPRHPQPATGRTHMIYAMHSRRYVTEAEAARLNGAERVPVVFAVAYVGVVYLLYRRARGRWQSGSR
jgi:hypothetical protein